MVFYITKKNDVLDYICWKHYGSNSFVSDVLNVNPSLAEFGEFLPAGLKVALPLIDKKQNIGVKLWS